MEKALPGSDSTKAMGAIAPESSFKLPDGVVVYSYYFFFFFLFFFVKPAVSFFFSGSSF
jgi:hypothetical protein